MNFNYVRMIEPLSDMAFTDIKNQLFHVFKEDKKYHPVMYLDDYRKVDLEENIDAGKAGNKAIADIREIC